MIITDYVHIPPVTKLLQVGNYLFGVAAVRVCLAGVLSLNICSSAASCSSTCTTWALPALSPLFGRSSLLACLLACVT
jgi:hypothetical protein